jgi:hypothetical protein
LQQDSKRGLVGGAQKLLKRFEEVHNSFSFGFSLPSFFEKENRKDINKRKDLAMGGHGYSAYNAIAGHIADYGVLTTGSFSFFILLHICNEKRISILYSLYCVF